jgi:hypothetical protein
VSQPYALFCSNPLDPRTPEPDFAVDVAAAREAGLAIALVDHDELERYRRPTAALRKTRIDEGEAVVYRGWMLRAEAYEGLYNVLLERNVHLFTSPQEYAACHHGPNSYAVLQQWTPKATWVPENKIDDAGAVRSALAPFGSSAVILKDWVKSQAAGYWREACFVTDASDAAAVDRVVSRFRELQGDSLVGGLYFKACLDLQPSGSPAHEYRAFFVGGRIVGCWPRSEDAKGLTPPPASLLEAVAAAVPSPFASADFGVDDAGRWWLLEVGDGQVSSLPDGAAASVFAALATAASGRGSGGPRSR